MWTSSVSGPIGENPGHDPNLVLAQGPALDLLKDDVGRAEREAEPAALEGGEERRPADILAARQGAARRHQLADEVAEQNPVAVEDEGHPLVVAAAGARAVVDEEVPVRAEQATQASHRLDPLHLLDRADVEMIDDFGDVVKALVQPWPAAVELPDVPRADDQRVRPAPEPDLAAEQRAQPQEPRGDPAGLARDVLTRRVDARLQRFVEGHGRSPECLATTLAQRPGAGQGGAGRLAWRTMTTRLALVLFAALVALILGDLALETGLSLGAARLLVSVIEALAIWR